MDELGVKDKDLASAIKQFPQLLGMKVEERMKPNITKIEYEFKIKGPAMKNVLKRKPQVLGFNWDCLWVTAKATAPDAGCISSLVST